MVAHAEFLQPRLVELRDEVQPQRHLVSTIVTFHLSFQTYTEHTDNNAILKTTYVLESRWDKPFNCIYNKSRNISIKLYKLIIIKIKWENPIIIKNTLICLKYQSTKSIL